MREHIEEEIADLHEKSVRLYHEGKYKEALEMALKTYTLVSQHLHEEHPYFTASLNNLAVLYFSTGKYTKAEQIYTQVIDIERNIYGEDNLELAPSLSNLASLYFSIGRYAEAEQLNFKVLDIRRKALGQNHPDFATSLNNLADLYRLMGKYTEAISLYQESLEIRRCMLGDDDPFFAQSLNNLGVVYMATGDYTQAESFFMRAIEIQRNSNGENHVELAGILNNVAVLYRLMRIYTKSESFFRQSIEIRRNLLGEDHPDFAQSLNNLAILYNMMGKDAEAERLLLQAKRIWRNAFGEDHINFATSISNLAEHYRLVGKYEKSEYLHQQAIRIQRNVLGEKHPDLAQSLNNLGTLYGSMGRYSEAEQLHHQAIDIKSRILGKNHQDFAVSLENLALIYAATDRESEALSLKEQSAAVYDRLIGQVFSIASESQRVMYLKTIQWSLDGFLSLIQQNLSQSPKAIHSGLEIVLRRKALTAEALAIQRDTVLGGRYPELALKLKDLSALRMQIAMKTLIGPGQEDMKSYQQTLAEWNIKKDQLEAELARQIPEMNLEERLRQVDLETVANVLPEKTALIEFVRFNVFDFKAVPAKGESQWKPARYIAFVVLTERPDDVQMIDLGEAEPIDNMIAAFRDSVIQEGEREARNIGVLAKTANVSAEEDGIKLKRRLFEPLLDALNGCKRLFLAPDGDLARLPFEILPLDDNRRLIDEYHISYLGAGRDILRFGQIPTRQPATPLVVADPDFDLGGKTEYHQEEQKQQLIMDRSSSSRHSRELDESHIHFEPLEGTRIEGERIGDMLDVQPWFGRHALESKLKASRSPRILHIATHGFFLTDQERDPNKEMRGFRMMGLKGFAEAGFVAGTGLENPLLRSGLALAGANTFLQEGNLPPDAEDGLLTAEDVTGLDLLDTDLVVLSACETGLGEVHVGEGVFGLRRSFVIAGAKTLVMSLWKVPDEQTQELMVDFYQRLLKGEGRAEALRNAQLAMKAKYPHPFYWGAFICQGDLAPLAK